MNDCTAPACRCESPCRQYEAEHEWDEEHEHERHVVDRVCARMRILGDHEAAMLVDSLWASYEGGRNGRR